MNDDLDADLVRRAAAGDAAAFGRLVAAHQSMLRGFLRRVLKGDEALADDLAQEAFFIAWQKIASFRGESLFSTWLIRIAWFRVTAQAKRKDIRLIWEPDNDLSTPHDASEARMDLDRYMPMLAADERAALTLCFAMGYSQSEAAEVMGLPLGTLKSHVTRGKARLRTLMGLEGA